MAKLVAFVACASVDSIPMAKEEPITRLVSPQIVIRPQYIPCTFSFGIAVGIADIDMQLEHSFRFTAANPFGEIIYDSGASLLPRSSVRDTMPMEFQGFIINIDIRNLDIGCEGEYNFSFYIDGSSVGEHKVPVFKRIDP